MWIWCVQLVVLLLGMLVVNVTSEENPASKDNLVPIQSIILSNSRIECPEVCSNDYCFKHISPNSNCTKLIRDQCDCCNVCLRYENDICGGRFNVHGICDEDLLCYQSNGNEQKGICVKGEKERFFLSGRRNSSEESRCFSLFEISMSLDC